LGVAEGGATYCCPSAKAPKRSEEFGAAVFSSLLSFLDRLLKKSFFSQTRPWANKSKILSAGLPEANRIVFEK